MINYMINFIIKYKHKLLIKNVLLILENKQYILKDFNYQNCWCMCLFINNKLFFAIKNKEKKMLKIITFNSIEELEDFDLWVNHEDYVFLKELIRKSHMKEFKNTFLLEATDHMIEDLANFLRERSISANINCIDSANILDKILQDEFAHLYVQNEINDNKKCQGKGFD